MYFSALNAPFFTVGMAFFWLRADASLVVNVIIITRLALSHTAQQHSPAAQKVLNVQPEITDLSRLGLNVTVPNCWSRRLAILVIEDYALSRVDNRTALSLVCVTQRDRDARTATRPAMFRVIVCHRWLGLSRNCRESKLLRGRAKTNRKRH